MKIVTWNVNSIRQRLPNVLDFLGREAPDMLCLQELKCQDAQFPRLEIESAGYKAVVVGQKAYNGVAVLSRVDVQEVARSGDDAQARMVEVEMEGVRVINIYAPNGNPVGGDKYTLKTDFYEKLLARAKELLVQEVPFVICGDFNIIPTAIDAATPAQWQGDALYLPEMRAMYRRFLNAGLYDGFRQFERSGGHYSFWDYQAGAWPQNNGIRIDHFLMSPQVADKAKSCTIMKDERGLDNPSDHVPVVLEL